MSPDGSGQPVHDRVRRYLEERIINGDLQPGDSLVEMRIARELSVSRTPVREAIRALAEAHLVTYRPNAGAVVAQLGPDEVIELSDVRVLLESRAVELAWEHVSPYWRRQMVERIERMEEARWAGDYATLMTLDFQFHEQFVLLAGNRWLHRTWLHVAKQATALYLAFLRSGVADLSTMADRHRAILDAVTDGDVARARELVADHYLNWATEYARQQREEPGNSVQR